MTHAAPSAGATVIETPMVSAIIPCRNEPEFVGQCLESLVANDYPTSHLELLVVDGMSDALTRRTIEAYAQRFPFIRLLDNPKHSVPAAMNLGLGQSRGDVVMKVDAHSTYPRDYISRCVQGLAASGADNFGGYCRVTPRDDSAVATAIARVLSHPFGSGNAHVKVGVPEPTWAETTAFGCYRREVFQRVGTWNEALARSSDLDFNKRLRQAGGKILMDPGIVISYYADPDLQTFWKHNFADGVWATYIHRFGSDAWAWRHLVPLALVIALAVTGVGALWVPSLRWAFGGLVVAYLAPTIGVSLAAAMRERRWSHALVMPVAFAIRHIAHGVGAFWGACLALTPWTPVTDAR